MATICVPIPPLRQTQAVELEVKVDGKRRIMNYRVESFDWTAGGTDFDGRIDRLRTMIGTYDPRWELVQIGNPSAFFIPVMFRERVMEA